MNKRDENTKKKNKHLLKHYSFVYNLIIIQTRILF